MHSYDLDIDADISVISLSGYEDDDGKHWLKAELQGEPDLQPAEYSFYFVLSYDEEINPWTDMTAADIIIE